jgi:hypothetical protein
MSLSTSKASLCLVATLAIAAALGLSACSRSQSLTDSLTGPAHDGALALAAGGKGKGHGGGGGQPPPPPPPGPSTNPCASLNGLSGTVVNVAADIPQFRIGRLRIEVSGDTPAGTIDATGICAAAANPAVSYISGSGNVFRNGVSVTATGGAITFGALLSPGLAIEPGVVLATDAGGNVLEIIWPGLAGLPPGPPILRLQLGQFSSSVQAGDRLDATMQFNARAPDGTTATFGVSASGMTVPPLKL